MQLLPLLADKSFEELAQGPTCFTWIPAPWWWCFVTPPERVPAVPEPSMWIMLALGIVIIAVWKLRAKFIS